MEMLTVDLLVLPRRTSFLSAPMPAPAVCSSKPLSLITLAGTTRRIHGMRTLGGLPSMHSKISERGKRLQLRIYRPRQHMQSSSVFYRKSSSSTVNASSAYYREPSESVVTPG